MNDKYKAAFAALVELVNDETISYEEKIAMLSDLFDEIGIIVDKIWDARQLEGE